MSLVTAVEILNYKLASFSPHIIIILNAFYLVFMYNIQGRIIVKDVNNTNYTVWN